MRDFLPVEKARREGVLRVIRDTYRAHGFDEIETPVVEDWSRLTSGLGGDNEKLSYQVLRRGIGVDELHSAASVDELVDLGLRFDLTVPLVRFYASHRAELPAVFRAIQAAPVWRAERPQKGRYRQFVQCDIDVFGEPGPLAEIELLTATFDVLTRLGLADASIRINDRRLLTGMLLGFGFAAAELDGVLITVDKLDKIGPDGVVTELRERGATPAGADALEAFLRRPTTMEFLPFGEPAIRKALPDGADDAVVAQLAAIGDAVTAAVGGSGGDVADRELLRFDPFLVRGMGYYTGAIFEIAHPGSESSIGGGGRYDGMVGRFLGTDVPAAGISLGFERLAELLEAPDGGNGGVALVYDADVTPSTLATIKTAVIATDARVRLVPRTKNVAKLLDDLAADGFTRFAFVDTATTADTLGLRPLG